MKPKSALLKAIKAIFNAFSRSASPTGVHEPRPPIERTGAGTMPVHVEEAKTDDQIKEDIKQLSQKGKPYADVPFDLQ